MDKTQIRTMVLERRAALDAETRRQHGAAASRHALQLVPRTAQAVAGYAGFRDEIDPEMLMDLLHLRGVGIGLPVVIGPNKPLQFRRWQPRDLMESGPHGIPQPRPSAPLLEPEIIFMPLVAFDRAGGRLGYGAGYYDRTLKAIRAKRKVSVIGLAYSCQEVPHVPVEAHDQLLDAIVTERGVVFAMPAETERERA